MVLPKEDFTSAGNVVFRKARIDSLNLHILLIWLGRHVMYEHYSGSKYFGGSEEGSDFVFWFKHKYDKEKAEKFFREIVENGLPITRAI